jgi:hypothetical protein
MPDVFLLGLPEAVEALAPDDPPDEVALCLSAGPLHQEARLPLYALMHGLLIDDAKSFEFLVRALAEEGPFLLGVDPRFSEKLASLEDDAIEVLMAQWPFTLLILVASARTAISPNLIVSAAPKHGPALLMGWFGCIERSRDAAANPSQLSEA